MQILNRARGLDEIINDAFMPIAQLWEDLVLYPITFGPHAVPVVLLLLIFGGSLFTIYFRFVNVRRFGTAIQVVRGRYDDLEDAGPSTDIIGTIKDESVQGEVNHFQALATAVSGTVGLGNIALVAVAISMGGPGVVFWMILAGLLGMSAKFVECTLGVLYREVDKNGTVYGGPMFYLSKGLSSLGKARLGKILAAIFAIMCVGASFGGGNAFQSNQAAAQLIAVASLDGPAVGLIVGICFAVLVGIVIIGGIKRIAQITGRVVPFMAVLYTLSALVILISNYQVLDEAILSIFQEAFTPRASVTGGMTGVLLLGFRRAAFSNEAGAGSAAIAHAAVRTKHPASEGLVALLEPFIDTVVVCTMTALVIIVFNQNGAFTYGELVNDAVQLHDTGEFVGGVNLTSKAFEATIPGFSIVLAVAVVLFAFSTIISWSYYGLQSWMYLFGKSARTQLTFKCIFLMFTVLGSAITLEAVIKFSDAMILALVFPNMIGLLFLFPKVKVELQRYLVLIRKRK